MAQVPKTARADQHDKPTVPVERESHTEEELNNLEIALGNLERVQNALFSRVNPVVHDVEKCGPEEASPEPYRVPLAHRIRCARYRIDGLREDTESILNRVEL